ncbi:hypothetical protein QVD17_38210 [Tagetes erecta]|uniref:Uncharacterized protein n=1 Tax=Tagetes erecta TaxID=13708 RepID=A0AAD8JXI2_TARER|nr:hypothetical protein QVD17_38210 [Tagetes erecta]
MFETTLLQVAKACNLERKDNHEHIKFALVTQTKSNDNQEEEEEYDWGENCDHAKELENKDKENNNLSETIAKQDKTIAQLNSEIKRFMSEKEIEKDVQSSYVEMPIAVREKIRTKECSQEVEHYITYSFRICDKLKNEVKKKQ